MTHTGHTTSGVTLYVILERYDNYRGRHSSIIQKHATRQEAIAAMPEAVAGRFGCATPEEWERIHRSSLDAHFTSPARDRWVLDDGKSERIDIRVARRTAAAPTR